MTSTSLLVQDKSAYATVDAPCPYFGTCGGCTLQDLAYHDQLALKQAWIHRAFQALDPTVKVEIQALDDPWRYRNKAELTFSQVDGQLALGYHAARSFWRVVDLEDCLLLSEPMAQLIREVRRCATESGQPAYNPKTHQGFFRYLTVRHSRTTGQLLICVTTTPGPREDMERFADALMDHRHDVTSLYWGVRSSVADIAVPEELILLRGVSYLEDQVGPFRLAVHPLTFLQPTSEQAQRLYDCVVQAVDPAPGGVAWDLYCGMGLVAFYLAPKFRMVYGIDSIERNIELAVLNASRNHVTNVDWRVGKAEDLLRDRRFWLQEARPELVVVDPPRSGLHPRAVTSVAAARPKQIAYLSCNVQALARDLAYFCRGYPRYRVRVLRAFDMFPQTNHVEVFALLER